MNQEIDTSKTSSAPLIKWGWLRAIVFIPVLIVCMLLVGFAFQKLFNEKSIADKILRDSASLVNQLLGLLLAIFICRKFIDRKDFSSLGISFKFKEFLLGSLFGIVLITIGSAIIGFTGWGTYRFQGFDATGLSKYLLMFMLVAIMEEFMVRTYLLNNLMASMNKYVALVLTSVLFSLLHAGNEAFGWLAFFELSLAGVLLGLWYIHRLDIWFPVGLHLTWNYFQGPVYGHEVSGHPIKESILAQTDLAEAFFSGGKFGVEGSIAGIAITYFGCLWIEWYLRQKTKKKVSS